MKSIIATMQNGYKRYKLTKSLENKHRNAQSLIERTMLGITI